MVISNKVLPFTRETECPQSKAKLPTGIGTNTYFSIKSRLTVRLPINPARRRGESGFPRTEAAMRRQTGHQTRYRSQSGNNLRS